MAKRRDNKKKTVKMYRKVRNNSFFGTFATYVLFLILFSFFILTVFFSFMEYILEAKFDEEYMKVQTLSNMYEEEIQDSKMQQLMGLDEYDYLVTDASNNIIAQHGRNTCSFEKGTVYMANGNELYTAYKDIEADYIYPKKDGNIGIKWNELRKLFTSVLLSDLDDDSPFDLNISKIEEKEDSDADENENDNGIIDYTTSQEVEGVVISYGYNQNEISKIETVKIPLWIQMDINEGRQHFIGKALFSFKMRDVILAGEIFGGVVLVTLLISIVMFCNLISSAVNFHRIMKLFYNDPVTNGHNWMWYLKYGEIRINKGRYKNKKWASVNLVFKNYRNYCLCHSVDKGEALLEKLYDIITSNLEKDELCAHSTPSNYALLLKCENEDLLKMRLNELIKKLQEADSDHILVFQMGCCIAEPYQNRIKSKTDDKITDKKTNNKSDNNTTDRKAEKGKKHSGKKLDIEYLYNNACTARTTLSDTDECGIRIFDNKLKEEQEWNDVVQEHQWSALEKEEFVVYYQPKYDPRTNLLRGAEALIRWESPEYGFVTPGRIIPLFEKNGFVTEIDHYMISHVARDQKEWLDAGYKCVPISVNVSRAHFVENDLAEQIRDMVDEAGCPHNLIEIELTESAFFDDKNAMIKTIKKLKEYGFAVSMDDFGAGYSSLNSLKDMPLDVLKLDADFFRGEDAGERGDIVVSEAIKLAKSLNMRTVAEGVEEKEQVEFLATQGCDMIQGYYYAKPMPKTDYMKRMTA